MRHKGGYFLLHKSLINCCHKIIKIISQIYFSIFMSSKDGKDKFRVKYASPLLPGWTNKFKFMPPKDQDFRQKCSFSTEGY